MKGRPPTPTQVNAAAVKFAKNRMALMKAEANAKKANTEVKNTRRNTYNAAQALLNMKMMR